VAFASRALLHHAVAPGTTIDQPQHGQTLGSKTVRAVHGVPVGGTLVAIVLCVSLGCSTTPLLETNPHLPTAFEQSVAGEIAWPSVDWYRGFSSAELDRLIELAQRNNLDLLAAQARIRQADARARAAGAAILPQVDAVPTITHFAGRSHGTSANETDWSVLLSATYEFDFWGKNRATADAARASAVATRADRDTLALTTTAGVANAYFLILSLRERVSLAESTLASTREVLSAIQARFDFGAASIEELAAQRAAVANTELAVVPLQQQEIEARGALALLVGDSPEQFAVVGEDLSGLIEPAVAPGLPAELLARRPDVLSAEATLQAAHADVAAARAALFPSLTLTASGGIQNPAMQAAVTTLAGTGPSITAGAALVQALFDGGRRRAVREEAESRQVELLATYRAAILSALLDVETALSAIEHLNAQRTAQQESVTQSERAFEASRLRYRAGAGDYLTMLDAQRTLYAARDQMSQYRLARLQAFVSLCKALGGGWEASLVASGETQPATTR